MGVGTWGEQIVSDRRTKRRGRMPRSARPPAVHARGPPMRARAWPAVSDGRRSRGEIARMPHRGDRTRDRPSRGWAHLAFVSTIVSNFQIDKHDAYCNRQLVSLGFSLVAQRADCSGRMHERAGLIDRERVSSQHDTTGRTSARGRSPCRSHACEPGDA